MTVPRNAVQTDRGRIYRWGDESFISVTNILSKGVPKPALTSWAAKMAAEFAVENIDAVAAMSRKDTAAAIDQIKGSPWRKRDKAADLGTKLHEAAEAHVLGKPVVTESAEEQAFYDAFTGWLDTARPTFEAAEFTVFSRKYGYAGTSDAIAVIGGKRWLIDYKTSEKGPYPEAGLQLAAYRFGEFIGAPDGTEIPVPAVDRCGVLKVRPEGCTLYPIRADDEMWRFFLYAQQTARFLNDFSASVIGAPEPVAIANTPEGLTDRNGRPIAPANVDALVGEA